MYKSDSRSDMESTNLDFFPTPFQYAEYELSQFHDAPEYERLSVPSQHPEPFGFFEDFVIADSLPTADATFDMASYSTEILSAETENEDCPHATLNKKCGEISDKCFNIAMLHPPLSLRKLGELQANNFMVNPKVRHDLNFDRDLAFIPTSDNFSPEQRKRIEKLRGEYWCAIRTEVEHIYRTLTSDVTRPEGDTIRLKALFESAQDILIDLLPRKERNNVRAIFSLPYFMGLSGHGLEQFDWRWYRLGNLMKIYCHHKRDPLVDKMVERLSYGLRVLDKSAVVDGLKSMFLALEKMRLDASNHQVYSLRQVLIANTVHFERLYNKKRLADGEIDLQVLHTWYNQPLLPEPISYSSMNPGFLQFIRCFVTTLTSGRFFSGPDYSLPHTFQLDYNRSTQLRQDMRHLILEDVAMTRLRTVTAQLSRSAAEQHAAEAHLRHVLPTVAPHHATARECIAHVAVELMRAAATPASGAPPGVGGGAAAVRIPDHMALCAETEWWLAGVLEGARCGDCARQPQAHAEVYATAVERVRHGVLERVARIADACAGIDECTIRLMLTPFVGFDEGRLSLGDIARRIAHLAVLHWRCWEGLVYEV